jgi:hypothetical protein
MINKREWMVVSFSLLVVTLFLQLSYSGLRKCVAATAQGDAPRVTQSIRELSVQGASLLRSH